MKTVGLITEYNPFHNGHLFHLRESLAAGGAETAVAVMSGHFLQRGEPALLDKWVRAEMALRSGVDLVVEIPFPWACNSAPHFALGAVRALDALGGVDSLCFGSEAGELSTLAECAELLVRREKEISEGTEALLRQGLSYPVARARVLAEAGSIEAETLASPNNILGIEYLKALGESASPIKPLTIRRTGAGYHDRQPGEGGIASATAVRALLAEGLPVADYLPEAARPPFFRAIEEGNSLDGDAHLRLLLAQIFRGREHLRGIYQVDNGLENRLADAADVALSSPELAASVKSRQLTLTRIQRILSYILNDVKREEMEAFLETGPLYLHLLACSRKGRAFLGSCRKKMEVPLVQNYSRIHSILKRFYGSGSENLRLAEAMLALELRATRNYSLLTHRRQGGSRNRDFFREPIFLEGEGICR